MLLLQPIVTLRQWRTEKTFVGTFGRVLLQNCLPPMPDSLQLEQSHDRPFLDGSSEAEEVVVSGGWLRASVLDPTPDGPSCEKPRRNHWFHVIVWTRHDPSRARTVTAKLPFKWFNRFYFSNQSKKSAVLYVHQWRGFTFVADQIGKRKYKIQHDRVSDNSLVSRSIKQLQIVMAMCEHIPRGMI